MVEKINLYSGIFWGVVLLLIVLALNPSVEPPEPECSEIVRVYRTATVTFDFCVPDSTVKYRDEWRRASKIETRLWQMEVQRQR